MPEPKRIQMSFGLTNPDIGTSGDPSRTYEGMAHFAGGSDGSCGDCFYFKKGKCSKAADMARVSKMKIGRSVKIPAHAAACKYFEKAR